MGQMAVTRFTRALGVRRAFAPSGMWIVGFSTETSFPKKQWNASDLNFLFTLTDDTFSSV